MSFIIALLAGVVLASPFGVAEASAIDNSHGLTVEMTVAYDPSATAVIVRPFSDYEELPPTAMTLREDGTWIAWVVLPTSQNWKIGFEGFPAKGGSELSETTDLLAMGVDAVVLTSPDPAPLPPKPLIPEGSFWLIVGALLAVAALGALAWWTFSDHATDDGQPTTDPGMTEGEATTDQPSNPDDSEAGPGTEE